MFYNFSDLNKQIRQLSVSRKKVGAFLFGMSSPGCPQIEFRSEWIAVQRKKHIFHEHLIIPIKIQAITGIAMLSLIDSFEFQTNVFT